MLYVPELDADGIFAEVLRQMFGRIYRPVLAAGAAERYGEAGEPAFEVFLDAARYERIDIAEEILHFAFAVEKLDDGKLAAGEAFVLFVFAGIVDGAAVEDESSAVARWVGGNAAFVRKTADADG